MTASLVVSLNKDVDLLPGTVRQIATNGGKITVRNDHKVP